MVTNVRVPAEGRRSSTGSRGRETRCPRSVASPSSRPAWSDSTDPPCWSAFQRHSHPHMILAIHQIITFIPFSCFSARTRSRTGNRRQNTSQCSSLSHKWRGVTPPSSRWSNAGSQRSCWNLHLCFCPPLAGEYRGTARRSHWRHLWEQRIT